MLGLGIALVLLVIVSLVMIFSGDPPDHPEDD